MNNKLKVFISQPMKDLTNDEILKTRDNAIKQVKDLFNEEIEIIDSFLLISQPIRDNPLWFLGRSIQILSTADVIVFSKGWEEARGCRIEHECASCYGKRIIEL